MSEFKSIKPIKLDDTKLAIIQNAASDIDKLEKEYEKLPNAKTDDGYADIKREAKELQKARKAVDNARAEYTAPLFNQKRDIDNLVNKTLIPRYEALEAPRKAAIKIVNDENKRIEQAKIDAERERVDAMQALFDDIDQMKMSVSLEDVNKAIEKLNTLDLQALQKLTKDAEEADEKIFEYEQVSESMLEWLTTRKHELEAQAAEAAKIEAEREKLKQEQEATEQKRIEAEAAQKAIEAENQRKADELAQRERRLESAENENAATPIRRRKVAPPNTNAEKLRSWFKSIPDLASIDRNDADAVEARQKLLDCLNNMDSITQALINKTTEAA